MNIRTLEFLLSLAIAGFQNLAQAQIRLRFTNRPGVDGPLGMPVTNVVTGARIPAGNSFRVQLYYGLSGADESTLVAAQSPPIGFFSPGFFDSTQTLVTGISPGATIPLQARCWENALGASYEEAVSACARGTVGAIGKSGVIAALIPSPIPPQLPTAIALPSFGVTPCRATGSTGVTLSPVRYRNSRFELQINGPQSRSYRMDASTDLIRWSVLASNVTGGALLFTDSGTNGFRHRVYRACISPEAHGPGENILALQGLLGNTLVAGKSTAFRLFTDELTYSAANRIEVIVLRPDGSRLTKSWPRPDFVAIPNSSRGRSLVARVPGSDVPWVGGYYLEAKVLDALGGVLATYSLDQVELLPTKDLLVGIDRLWAGSVNPGTPQEIQAARDAMQRLASVWPIRDGISTLDGDRSAGLRYVINNNPSGPPAQDGHLCPFFASWLNRPAGLDSINVGVAYRFQDPGEGCGGSAPHFCTGQTLPWAFPVCNGPLGAVFGQEMGHCWGLEPPEDPHWDSTVQAGHSKDATIDPLDAELGFDVQRNRPFATPMYDNMHQVICGCSDDKTCYNSWDWEYLRKAFVRLSSTGPTTPTHFTTDVAPAAAGVGNSIYFIAKRRDGRIYYNHAVLGQAGVGWVEMDGDGRTDAAPAAGAVGSHIFVTVKGLNNTVFLNQADEARSFNPFWLPISFTSDTPQAVSGVGNNVYIFAKHIDGRIFYNRAVLGQALQGWVEVDGNGRTDVAPAAGAVGTHVFVAVKAPNGTIFFNQADLGRSFNPFWNAMDFTTDVPPAVAGVGNSVYIFAKHLDGRIFYNRAVLGQSFQGWTEVDGGGRTDAAPAAGAVGDHVFVAVKGLDGRIFINQADLGQHFGQWFP